VERQKHGGLHSPPGPCTVSPKPSISNAVEIVPKVFVTCSPPPNLSPPLSYGVTHTMPGSLFGTGRNLNDSYASAYSVNRPGFTSVYSNTHEPLRYGNQYPQAQRATESYAFSSTNGTYHHPPTMTLESTAKPITTRPDGPPFGNTQVIHPIITSLNHQLVPEIAASIQKGFFQADGKWTCYRRNYFTVSCSFSFRTSSYEGQLYLRRHSGHQAELIKQFAISISAKTAIMNSNQESEVRTLVQHTPKRDKATESIPGKVPIQPAPTLSLSSSDASPAHENLHMNPQQAASSELPDSHSAPSYSSTPPTSYTFERIQFQKATANNGKRRAQQQYFHIVVELSADVSRTGESPRWVKIATKQSEPMVVRGRSPGHYKDNGRRDSTASMDPDRGSGASGDLGAGLNSANGLLGSSPSHPSSMDWESSHHTRNSRGGYRRIQEPNISPPSDISTDSTPSSPPDPGTSYQTMQPKAPGHRNSLASKVLRNSVVLSSIDCKKKDVPRLNLRNCGVDMMLPKPSYSSLPRDFGIYGTQHIDMHTVPHFQAICS
jgi:meiosis-specific transcription factor NDT80